MNPAVYKKERSASRINPCLCGISYTPAIPRSREAIPREALHRAVTAVTERRGILPPLASCSAMALSRGRKSSGITLCMVSRISSQVTGRNIWEMLSRSIKNGTADKSRKKEDPAENSRI